MDFKAGRAQPLVLAQLAGTRYGSRTLALDKQMVARQKHEVVRGVAATLPDHSPMLAAEGCDACVKELFDGGLTHACSCF